MSERIRIVIADDHPIFRKGLRMTIEEDANVEVVGDAGDGEAALAAVRAHAPRIVVLDIDMPRLDGFGVARAMATMPNAPAIIFLTLHDDEDFCRAAMEVGARGYLLKDSAIEEIGAAIRIVAAGQVYLSSTLTVRLLDKQRQAPTPATAEPVEAEGVAGLGRLTPAERRILRLIASGLSSKEIGEQLSTHYRTVENHRTNICRKLGIEGANSLVRFALQYKARLE